MRRVAEPEVRAAFVNFSEAEAQRMNLDDLADRPWHFTVRAGGGTD